MPAVQVVSPDGTVGSIPAEQQEAALAQGYKLPPTEAEKIQPGSPISEAEMRTTPAEVAPKTGPVDTIHMYSPDQKRYLDVPHTQALAATKAGFVPSDDTVQVVDPDGKLGSVPGGQLAAALTQGYRLPGTKEVNVHELAEQIEHPTSEAEEIHKGIDPAFWALGTGSNKFTQGPIARNIPAPVLATVAELGSPFDSVVGAIKSHGAAGAEQLLGVVQGFKGPARTPEQNEAFQRQIEAKAEAASAQSKEEQEELSAATQQFEGEHPYAGAAGWLGAQAATIYGAPGLAKVTPGLSAMGAWAPWAVAGSEGLLFNADQIGAAALNKDPAGMAEAVGIGLGVGALTRGIGLGGQFIARGLGRAATEGFESLSKDLFDDLAKGGPKAAAEKLSMNTEEFSEHYPKVERVAGITPEDTQKEVLGKLTDLEKNGPKEAEKAYKFLDDQVENKSEILQNTWRNTKGELGDAARAATQLEPAARDAALKSISEISGEFSKWANSAESTFSDLQKIKDSAYNKFGEAAAGTPGRAVLDSLQNNFKKAEGQALEEWSAKNGKPPPSDVIQGLNKDEGLFSLKKLYNGIGNIPEVEKTKPWYQNLMKDAAKMGAGKAAALIGLSHFMPHVGALSIGAYAGKKVLAAAAEKIQDIGFKRLMRGALDRTMPATAVVSDSAHKLSDTIGKEAKELFGSLATQRAVSHASQIDHSLGHFLEGGGNGKDRQHQLADLRRQVTFYQTNPTAFASNLKEQTEPLRREGLGPVADAYSAHALRMMKVIQAVIPKDPSMMQSHPFAAVVQPEDISPATKAKYERALTIAADPVKLLGLVKSNTITPMDVAIAAASNPQTLQRMRDALVAEGLKNKPDLTYQQRISMSILMGTNIQESAFQLAPIQSTFVPPIPQGSTGSAPAKGGGKGLSAKSQDNIVDANLPTSAKGAVAPR